MSPSSNMGDDLKFRQRWEFRRRDHEFDSSSDECKSSSNSQPVLKKHKLVSSLISHENDEATDTDRLQQKGKCVPGTSSQTKYGKAKKKHAGRSRKDGLAFSGMERDSHEEFNRKKTKTSAYEPAAVDDVKIFMESLLEDLRVARENLLKRMKEEMKKLAADDNAPKPESRRGSCGRENIQVQLQNNFEENIQVQPEKCFVNNLAQDQNNFEENVRVQHQHNFEDSVREQHQNNFKEGVLVQHQHNFEDSVREQHQNNFKESVLVQHQNNCKETIEVQCQHNFKENIQVHHQNNFEENIQVQHQSNLKSGMRAQNYNEGFLKRSTYSNNAAGYHNFYQELEDQVDYGQATGPMTSTAKGKEEILASSVKRNFQSSPSILDVQVQHQKNFVLGSRAQNCNAGSSKRFVKGKNTTDPNNCFDVLEDRVDYDQTIGSMLLTEKDKEDRLGLSVDPKFSSNSSGQVTSSMYLTLPSVLTEPCVENHKLDTFPCNYVQPRAAGIKRDVNSENANLMLDSSANRGYFPDMQQQESIGSFAQTSSDIIGCFNENSTPTTRIGTGFPVPLHRGMDGGFSISSQLSLKNPPQENYNILGLRMHGGAIRFSGGSYALSEQHVANNFHMHSNYIADGGLMAFQVPDLKEGHLFPK